MDEENKNIEDGQDFPENFDDTFEIGISVDDTLKSSDESESQSENDEIEAGRGAAEKTESEPESETNQVPENNPERDEPESIESDTSYEVTPESDTFEIGISIEDTLNIQDGSEPETETDQESEDTQASVETENFENVPPDSTSPEKDPFDEIKDQIADLSQAFESKLKYDEHKNKIIDDLHQSLQEFREGLMKKYLHRFITDIIKIVDDMRKFSSHYKDQPASEETTEKLLKYIENISSDLEDLFSWEGVMPFTCNGDIIDPSRQRVLNKIKTDDPEKDKTVAERLRPGYEWDGKIIRPEMVSAYIYQTESTAEESNNS